MSDQLNDDALNYHSCLPAGKLQVTPTKPMLTQYDLSLAYSPGVSQPCIEIQNDPSTASIYTSRANLVGVVTNGTAVLGLGNIGALAAKPVMEGKAVLFKKFAGVDAFDIEVNEADPQKFCDIVAALEPTFGGINLEDIKAPECFEIEKELKRRMNIPVFHDDQHGTAIVVGAAVQNALRVVGKTVGNIKIVCNGAGAAAIACLDILLGLGAKRDNIVLCDSKGVVFAGRSDLQNENHKLKFATQSNARSLNDAIKDADVFIGLSVPNALNKSMVLSMAKSPVILAMANPTPEIFPAVVKSARRDAIVATGRSDFPNQVNNVLCFPFIFRGALDAGSTTINDAMKNACVNALAELAREEVPLELLKGYEMDHLEFGPEYIIPKPLDPRLLSAIAPAVVKAAIETGVATGNIDSLSDYKKALTTSSPS